MKQSVAICPRNCDNVRLSEATKKIRICICVTKLFASDSHLEHLLRITTNVVARFLGEDSLGKHSVGWYYPSDNIILAKILTGKLNRTNHMAPTQTEKRTRAQTENLLVLFGFLGGRKKFLFHPLCLCICLHTRYKQVQDKGIF